MRYIMQKNKHDGLIQGSIWKGLLLFALPILLGQIFQQLYNTADAWIVGQFRTDQEYAAVTSTASLSFLLVGFFGGIAMGAGVVIARYYGAGDKDRLKKSVYTSVIFGLFAGVILSVGGVLLTPILLQWMGTPPEILPYSTEYFRYYFMGIIAVVLYNMSMGILRAVGDSKHPLYYLIFSSLLNIGLDFLFVGYFGWGVWSAALATTISQLASALLCIGRLMRFQTDYQFRFRDKAFRFSSLGEIIRYGLPSGIQNSIIAFANVIVQTNINSFGEDTVAGAGTYAKLEGFAFLPITCFTMALTTFVSQNLGARQFDRAKKGSRFGLLCCIVMAELIGLALILFKRPLIGFFTDNSAAMEVAMRQADIESLFFCMLALSHCIAAIMRGAGRPLIPMLVMLGAWCILRVTYISVLVPLIGKDWVIFSAYPVTWTTSSIVFLIFYFCTDWVHTYEKRQKKKVSQ